MSRPAWAKWVTRISLGLAIIALGWTIRNLGFAAIAKYFRMIGWWWIAVLVLEACITTLDAVAIRGFMSPEQDKVGLGSAVLSQLAGRSVNAVTPSGNLGEAVKVSVLTEHVSQSRAVATILLYNVVSFTVELGSVAIAALYLAAFVTMPGSIRLTLLVAGGACLVISIALYALVHHGMLTSVARLCLKLRLLSRPRYERWQAKLQSVDDKLRLVAGARKRDRWTGILAVIVSRATSLTLSLLILHVVGEPLTGKFIAAYTVGGFVVYLVSSLVPMGLGISEGGNYWLFRALGYNPARGVTVVIARRCTLVVYAAIGLVLVAASETVQRAKEKHAAAPVRESVSPTAALAVAIPVTPPSQVAAAHVTDVAD